MVSRLAAKTANIAVHSAKFEDSAAKSVPTFGACKPSCAGRMGRAHGDRMRTAGSSRILDDLGTSMGAIPTT